MVRRQPRQLLLDRHQRQQPWIDGELDVDFGGHCDVFLVQVELDQAQLYWTRRYRTNQKCANRRWMVPTQSLR